jgi:hypothetical protein
MVGGVIVQPNRTKTGIPDFLVKTKAGKTVGYVEAKDPMIDKLINEAQRKTIGANLGERERIWYGGMRRSG